MCYAQPGPRCSNHATEKLARATKAYEADPSRKVLYEAMKEAQEEYDTTPAGIKQLKAEGKTLLAELAEMTRYQQLNAYREKHPTVTETVDTPEIQQIRKDALSDDHTMRVEVAENRDNTPSDVLTHLATDPSFIIRAAVARNPRTPAETLARLADDKNENVRTMVGENSTALPETLSKLSKDENDRVRGWVALNPNLPPTDLARLGKDRSAYVRESVADNPNTPAETLTHLGKSKMLLVRNAVASNHSTPIGVTVALTSDSEKIVAGLARAALRSRPTADLVEALKSDYPEVTPEMPREWLIELLPTR